MWLVADVGTYPIPAGSTADVFKSGFHIPICNVTIHEDGNEALQRPNDGSRKKGVRTTNSSSAPRPNAYSTLGILRTLRSRRHMRTSP
jgi:hypothetical protein